MKAAERCSFSGDCLKNSIAGGSMCPSYMGTREEANSTRGRANILRFFFQGKFKKSSFTEVLKDIKFHAHCYQKSLYDTKIIERVLSFSKKYSAKEIPSGCCGMA